MISVFVRAVLWVFRVTGSIGGILAVLVILVLVLKFVIGIYFIWLLYLSAYGNLRTGPSNGA